DDAGHVRGAAVADRGPVRARNLRTYRRGDGRDPMSRFAALRAWLERRTMGNASQSPSRASHRPTGRGLRPREPSRQRRRWRRLPSAAVTFMVLPLLALGIAVAFEPLPAALTTPPKAVSVRVVDRHGRLLREVAGPDGRRSQVVALTEVSPFVVSALLAAEDSRFFRHPGVDPIAIVRAMGQALREGRVVSGASTLTQQLARRLVPRERSLAGKLREAVVALRLEASLDKEQI